MSVRIICKSCYEPVYLTEICGQCGRLDPGKICLSLPLLSARNKCNNIKYFKYDPIEYTFHDYMFFKTSGDDIPTKIESYIDIFQQLLCQKLEGAVSCRLHGIVNGIHCEMSCVKWNGKIILSSCICDESDFLKLCAPIRKHYYTEIPLIVYPFFPDVRQYLENVIYQLISQLK